MSWETLLLFLTFIAIGSYIQSITGFAMGLIMMGSVTTLQLAPVAFTAAVISVLGPPGIFLALRKSHHHIHWSIMRNVLISAIPAMVLGVMLLNYLSATSSRVLQMVLAVVIIVSGILLILQPKPAKQLAHNSVPLLAGAVAGIFGGLFSTAGPPLVYYLYRQPLAIDVIRSTLLSIFMVGSIGRILVAFQQGHITLDVFWTSLTCLPCMALFIWLGRRYPPPLSDLAMRRFAFCLLLLLGVSLLMTSI